MKTLCSSLALHQAFHQQPSNRLAHAIAIPLMIFGAMIPLSWLGSMTAGAPVTLAMILTAALSLVYIQWNPRLGAALTIALTVMLYVAHVASELQMIEGALLSAACIAGGIALERTAHARLEGRIPPFHETMTEFVLGPLWLGLEAMSALGVGSFGSANAPSKSVAR